MSYSSSDWSNPAFWKPPSGFKKRKKQLEEAGVLIAPGGRVKPAVEQAKAPEAPRGPFGGTPLQGIVNPAIDVRNITFAYFKATGMLPTPSLVMGILKSPATNGLNAQQYTRMFKNADKLEALVNKYDTGPRPGINRSTANPEFFHQTIDPRNVPVDPNSTNPADVLYNRETAMGGNDPNETLYLPQTETGNTTLAKSQQDWKKIMDPQNVSAASGVSPAEDIRAFSEHLADRVRKRGLPVEWDVENPGKDPDFLRYSAIYAMGKQYAYSVYGKGSDQAEANKTIDWLRSIPLTGTEADKLGRKLGLGVADWSNQKTYQMVIDAMHESDDENTKSAIFDAWVFSRRIGQSKSDARYDYATKFGLERLPVKERMAYEKNNTMASKIGEAMMLPGRLWGAVEDMQKGRGPMEGSVRAEDPLLWSVGKMAQGVGWMAHEGTNAFVQVIETPFQALSTSYELLYEAQLKKHGMTYEEYQKYLSGGGKPFDLNIGDVWKNRMSPFHVEDWNTLVSTWEANDGIGPVGKMAEQTSLNQYGKVDPLRKDIGQVADIALMFYVGAKVDPVARESLRVAKNVSFKAGRWSEGKWADAVANDEAALLAGKVKGKLSEERGSFDWSSAPKEVLDARKTRKDLLRTAKDRDLTPEEQATHDAAHQTVMDYIEGKKLASAPDKTKPSPRAEEAEAFWTDTVSDLRGSGGPLDYGQGGMGGKEFNPADTGKDIQVRRANAYDEATRRTLKDYGYDAGPNLDRDMVDTALEKIREEDPAYSQRIYDHLADVLDERELWDIPTKKVDLANAPDKMFETDTLVAEGAQPALDMLVDTTAKKTEPFAAPPEKGPAQIPGQEGLPTEKVWYRKGEANEYSEFTFDPMGGNFPRMTADRGSGYATGQFSFASAGEGRGPVKAAKNPLQISHIDAPRGIRPEYFGVFDPARDMLRIASGHSKARDTVGPIARAFKDDAKIAPEGKSLAEVEADVTAAIETWKIHRQVHPFNILLDKWGYDGVEWVGDLAHVADDGTFGNVKFPPIDAEGKVVGLVPKDNIYMVEEAAPPVEPFDNSRIIELQSLVEDFVSFDEARPLLRDLQDELGMDFEPVLTEMRGKGLIKAESVEKLTEDEARMVVHQLNTDADVNARVDEIMRENDPTYKEWSDGQANNPVYQDLTEAKTVLDERISAEAELDSLLEERADAENYAHEKEIYHEIRGTLPGRGNRYTGIDMDAVLNMFGNIGSKKELQTEWAHTLRKATTAREAKMRRGPDEVASEIAEMFPESGITDAQSLLEWLGEYTRKYGQGRGRKLSAKRPSAESAARIDELTNKLEELDKREAQVWDDFLKRDEDKGVSLDDHLELLSEDPSQVRNLSPERVQELRQRAIELTTGENAEVWQERLEPAMDALDKRSTEGIVEEVASGAANERRARDFHEVDLTEIAGKSPESLRQSTPEEYADTVKFSREEFPDGTRIEVPYQAKPEEVGKAPTTKTGEVVGRFEDNGDLKVKLDDGTEGVVNPHGAVRIGVAPDGVKTKSITTQNGLANVDASAAELLQRSTDAGYPPFQSHGFPEDHPAGHPSLEAGVEPYIQYRAIDFPAAERPAKMARIVKAAKKLGLETERPKVDGRSTIIVKGNIRAFMDELVGGKNPPPKRGIVLSPPVDGAVPIRNKIFRTTAEVIAKMSDFAEIGDMFRIPESSPKLVALAKGLAEAKDVRTVEVLLRELDHNGIPIDGGASAIINNARQAAYAKGFGHRNFMHFFTTSLLYETSHPINGSTNAAYNYMKSNKLGNMEMTPAIWEQIKDFRRRLYEETNPNKKQVIVEEINDAIDLNIAKAGLTEKLERYKRLFYIAKGRKMMAGAKVAYHGVLKMVDGRPTVVEASRVHNIGKAADKVMEQLDLAEAEARTILSISKASNVSKARVETALRQAREEFVEVADAIETVDTIGIKETLTAAESKSLAEAHKVLDNYSHAVPLKMGQWRNHIEFRHNPKMLASFMEGPTSQTLALMDVAIAQPLMTMFKETVMSSMGFPIKVNVGDELIRFFPEGVVGRQGRKIFTARPLKKLEKRTGIDMSQLEKELHDRLAYDWAAGETGSWIYVTKDTHPHYYEYLAQDLQSWAAEPIVKKLIEENDGVFPSDVGNIKEFILKAIDEDSDLNHSLREFLEDTYRIDGSSITTAEFTEWCQLYQERLEVFASHKDLRAAMTGKVSLQRLKDLPDDMKYPVHAPEAARLGTSFNPLYQMVRFNPFHYVYQGVPVPFRATRKVGAVQLLGTISKWMRETVFSDRYWVEREAELKRAPHLAKSEEGLRQLHDIAAERALVHTNHVTYSRSSTLFEDATRNIIPFGNAYRQFWIYWAGAFAKHPFALSTYIWGYNKVLEDQFMGLGDYQAFLPAVPFLAAKDQDAPEGIKGMVVSNLPQFSFLLTGGARTMMGAVNIDASKYSKLPGLAGLDSNMAPFKRQANLAYGIFGWDVTFGGKPTLQSLFGDNEKRQKASANALLAQLHYDDGKLDRDTPWWWAGLSLPGEIAKKAKLGSGGHPEALFNESIKLLPNPSTVTYSPKSTRDKGEWTFNYYEAIRKGQTVKAAELRANHPWLDTFLSYYDATEEEKIAMKMDPKNKDMLKWWVSPYNYDQNGAPYDGLDWQTQFTTGRVSRKGETELEASINNLYVDIWGGNYVQSAYRQGGTQYMGDANRAVARKRTIAKMTHALKWADKMATTMHKKYGWDKKILMEQFRDAGPRWLNGGVWPSVLEAHGLDPNQYHLQQIATAFFDKSDEVYPTSKDPVDAVREAKYGKITPQTMSSADALRALDMTRWLPDPDLAQKMLTETPFAGTIKQTKVDQRNELSKSVLDAAALDQWYWIGSQQLRAVGLPASRKIDVIQNDLHADYLAMRELKVGSSEYKAARNAYWAKRDKLLGSVKGGKVLTGGIADRLIVIPFVLNPKVTGMGTGLGAVRKQAVYEVFLGGIKKELHKGSPDTAKIADSWSKLDWSMYSGKQRSELKRVASWAMLLAAAKKRRADMRSHYSDYYDAPGESAASKYGKQHVSAINEMVNNLKRFSPEFSKEINLWFGDNTNYGYRFLDWYQW